MKKIIIFVFLLLICSNSFAADSTVVNLTNDSSPTSDDLLYTVNDPTGTPADRKATIGNVFNGQSVSSLSDINSATVTAGNLLIADGVDFDSVAVSGDVTLASNGVATVVAESISLTDNSDVNSATVTAGNLLVADGVDFDSVAVTGDATLSSAGAISIVDNAISLIEVSDVNTATTTAGNILIADGTDFESKAISGDATIALDGTIEVIQADALESNGSNCSAGSYPLGVDASGAVESCTDATTEIDSLIATHAALTATHGVSGAIVGTTDSQTLTNKTISQDTNVVTADDVICVDCLSEAELNNFGSTIATATAGLLLVADGTDFEAVAMSGDCTITSAGAIDCVAAGGASSLTDLSDVNSATATAGRMLIANGTKFDSVEMSGSCTISASGSISCSGAATSLTDLSDVNASTATAGNILIADGTDFESIALNGDATINSAGLVTIPTGSISLTELSDVGTVAITEGQLLVADGTDYESVGMSGDVTISAAGATTITANSVALGTDTTGNYAAGDAESGNASGVACVECIGSGDTSFVGDSVTTATAANLMIADGTDFESIALSGDVTITSAGVATIPTSSISLTELSDVGTVSILAGQLLIADGTDYESVAMSGDTTITSAGVTTVVANSISLSDLSDVNTASVTAGVFLVADGTDYESVSMNGSCTMDKGGTVSCVSTGGATSLVDLSDVNTATATAGNILIADGTDFEARSMSGACTINADGIIACSSSATSLSDLTDVNATTATAGNLLVADGTDWESSSILSVGASGGITITGSGAQSTITEGLVVNNGDGTDVDDDFQVKGVGSQDLYFDTSAGSLGLGTASPSEVLEVLGDVKITGGSLITNTVTAGNLLVADGDSWESVALSGSCTITSAGVASCTGGSVTSLVDLSDVNSATVTAGNLLIADGVDFDSVAITGDIALTSAGATSVVAESISLTDLSDVNSGTVTAGNILIADGVDFDSIAISGACTLSSAGSLSCPASGGAGPWTLTGNVVHPDSSNTVGIGGSAPSDGKLTVYGDDDIVTLRVHGFSGQTSNYVEVEDSAGTNVFTAGSGGMVLSEDSFVDNAKKIGWREETGNGTNHISVKAPASITSNIECTLQDDATPFDSCITAGGGVTSLTDLSDVNASTATAGNILIADGTDFESVAMSGSCTLASSGAISCSGGSTKFLHVIQPHQMKLHSGSPMAIDAGNANWRGLFDASTTETATSSIVLYPYGNGGFDGVAVYSMASATSGTVEFDVYIDCSSPGDSADIDTVSYGSANSFTETVPGTAGYPESIAVTTLSHDSCAQGDYMNIKVERDTVSDSATGDAELRAIYIYEP